MSDTKSSNQVCARELKYYTEERPSVTTAFLLGFQHVMVCLSGMLVMAYLTSDFVCAGESTVGLRALLISSLVTVSGLVTLLQSTVGLRLAVLQGPAFAFVPPLYVFSKLPEMECGTSKVDYLQRLQIIVGSVVAAGVVQFLLGATGLIGLISRRVGPLTITPLMILLCIGNCSIVLEKASLHWISILQFALLLIFIFFINDLQIPVPVLQNKRIKVVRLNLFGLFPYLISILVTWLTTYFLTKYDLIPAGNSARVDNPTSIAVLKNTPWVQLSYPGQFGLPSFNLGLFLGCLTSCVASSIESLGAYKTLSRVSLESSPSASAINRATLLQGLGCCLFGAYGCGVGVTAYSENIAIISITKVASRFVIQTAGILLVVLGLFTKLAALLATIPDPIIGGTFGMSVCLVCGICLSNLQPVNLHNSRNVTIIGLSIILGIIIPTYVEQNPVNTGMTTLDQMMNILLRTKMFLGGFIAFVLDNMSGAPVLDESSKDPEAETGQAHANGYFFPLAVNRRLLFNHRFLRFLPFLPVKEELQAAIREQELQARHPSETRRRHGAHLLALSEH